MDTKTSPQFMKPMLESWINGNRNAHRVDYGLLNKEDKMTYLIYCHEFLTHEEFHTLLISIRGY